MRWIAVATSITSAVGGAARAAALEATDLVSLRSPRPAFEAFHVPDSTRVCRAGAPLVLDLPHAAELSLKLDGVVAVASVDGSRPRPVERLEVPAGRHRLYVRPPKALLEAATPLVLSLEAFALGRSGRVEVPLADDFVARPLLQVGHTFVSGVDLLDGHLVRQVTDIALKGRHLALQLTRTYASSGPSAASSMGAGWSHSYGGRVAPLPECGIVAVQTADGSNQTFRVADGGFEPQRGYHTRLRRGRSGGFEFVDKAGHRHVFREPAFPGGPALRLHQIEEPHADRIVLHYDGEGRLSRVDEWHPELLGAARSLLFSWTEAAGWPRLSAARAWGLGLAVTYRYDRHGNLVLVTRTDADEPDDPASDRYEYSTDDPGWPHRLTAVLEAGSERTDYEYRRRDAAAAAVAWPIETSVGQLTTRGDPGLRQAFVFDASHAAAGRFETTVDEGGAVTRYTLNADGNPLEIDSPAKAGRIVTRMRWDPAHVVKRFERSSSGSRRELRYDDRGNLVQETTRETDHATPRVSFYEYDREFNKLVREVKPDGSETRHELDPGSGDVRRTIAPGGGATSYVYDARGCRLLELAAGGRTEYGEHDSYCQPTLVRPPSGPARRFRFDARGNERKPSAVTVETPAQE